MIPGSNLLKTALSIIAPQSISYYKFLSRAENAIGQYINTYDTPVIIKGSFQRLPRNLYVSHDLDFQKSYFTFYTSSDLLDIQRDVSSDKLIFKSQTYQVESSNDWIDIDGWKGVLCVLTAGHDDN